MRRQLGKMENFDEFQSLIESIIGKEYDQDTEELRHIVEDFENKSQQLTDVFFTQSNNIVQDILYICLENKYVLESIDIVSSNCVSVTILSNSFDIEGECYKIFCDIIKKCYDFDIYKSDEYSQGERDDIYIKFIIKDDEI